MASVIERLRSLAAMPDGSFPDNEGDEWTRHVTALSQSDFDSLMQPLLQDDRRRLLALPTWSRTILAARWLAPPMNPAIAESLRSRVEQVALPATLDRDLAKKGNAPGCIGKKNTCTRTVAPYCHACLRL